MLRSVFQSLIRRRTSPGERKTEPGRSGFDVTASSLREEVGRLCAKQDVDLARAAILQRMPMPNTTEQSQWLIAHIVLPYLEACAATSSVLKACKMEHDIYTPLIRRFEDPAHYEACFSLIDCVMRGIGASISKPVAPLGASQPQRVMFFLHNLSADLAHTNLMCDILAAHLRSHPEEAPSIAIVGISGKPAAPRVRELHERYGVAVHALDPQSQPHGPLADLAQFIVSGTYDRVIFVSVPTGISFLTGLLPADRIGWFSLKYQLSCFDHLRHRCSLRSGLRRDVTLDGRRWLQAAPVFTGAATITPGGALPAEVQQARTSHRLMYYTVNREDKIRNPQFLQRVARLLSEVPDSVFVWTGRNRLPEIDQFFKRHRLEGRHVFAGWVVPDDLMHIGDIFLDTPVLSGVVAAKAAAGGVPVLFDADSINWLSTFIPAYDADRGSERVARLDAMTSELRAQGIGLECPDSESYVRQGLLLANDADLRRRFGAALKEFGRQYFFDAERVAADHLANFRAVIV